MDLLIDVVLFELTAADERDKGMYHLLLTFCLIIVGFVVLTRRYPVETVYSSLASVPALFFFAGIADEYFRGIQQINHRVLHVAYDSSYALLLIGIILLLRAILRRRLIVLIVAATCIAGVPLGYIFITSCFQTPKPHFRSRDVQASNVIKSSPGI